MNGTRREDDGGVWEEADAGAAAGMIWDEYRREWRDPWDVQEEEREAAWQREQEMMEG